MDLLLVVLSLFETIVNFAPSMLSQDANQEQVEVRRFLKIIRIIKIFRLIRILRFVHGLQQLVYSILRSLGSLVWSFVLLVFIIYLFGLICVKAATHRRRGAGEGWHDDLVERWSSIPTACFTLFQATTGGISWGEPFEPLWRMHFMFKYFSALYVTVMSFAILNVISAVFTEHVIANASRDAETVIQRSLEQRQDYINRLETLFKAIDADNSGHVSKPELIAFLDDVTAGAYFEFLELDIGSSRDLVNLLDTDGSDDLTLPEFASGCLGLRGQATQLNLVYIGSQLIAGQREILDAITDLAG